MTPLFGLRTYSYGARKVESRDPPNLGNSDATQMKVRRARHQRYPRRDRRASVSDGFIAQVIHQFLRGRLAEKWVKMGPSAPPWAGGGSVLDFGIFLYTWVKVEDCASAHASHRILVE